MFDLYQHVTDRIVAALEQGAPPWVRPWAQLPSGVPTNRSSHKAYRGVNFTLLSLEAAVHGYAVNQWLTYRQALQLGAQVRRGEQGATVVFWQLRDVESDDPDAEPPERRRPFLRAYTVFNVDQVDGLPTAHPVRPVDWAPEQQAEALLHASGASIRHAGAQAYYDPATDAIRLPPRSAFAAPAGYYGTALHELTHWTGHEQRCHRNCAIASAKPRTPPKN
jgi:antirestriction protein ArdC